MSSEPTYDEHGNLQRFLPIQQVVVPREIVLTRDQKRLCVNDEDYPVDYEGDPKSVSEECFEAFIKLVDASPSDVHRFAKNWGLLGLCKHSVPATHNQPIRVSGGVSGVMSRFCWPQPGESIEDWRKYSIAFGAMVKIADCLRANQRPTAAAWKLLGIGVTRRRATATIAGQRELLVGRLNHYLALSGIQPIAIWSITLPTLKFGCRGTTTLFAALTMQLAMNVTDCRIAFCSYCHGQYMPKRRPRAGEANYCPRCRKLHATTIRVRRLRTRLRTMGEGTQT